MWALRRASIHLRNQCLSWGSGRICSGIGRWYLENGNVTRGFRGSCSSWKPSPVGVQYVSSLSSWDAGAQNELEVPDEESDVNVGERKSPEIEGLTKVILSAHPYLRLALDEWVEAGHQLTPPQVSLALEFLLSRHLFDRALQLLEWLELGQKIEFTERDYATRVYLTAKLHGTFKAEEYIRHIPESFRSEIVYTSLLKIYVNATNVHKAEDLFRKMNNLFPRTSISCNQMLFLYKKIDRKRVADIMSLMEKENIKPSSVTYQILIDVKGQSQNISELEQVFEIMKSGGVEPSLRHRASLAQYYAAGGQKDKADTVLKEMEGGDLVENRAACSFLLPVYASLGRDDEVGRIWRVCESNPTLGECIAAIKAWGQLKRIGDAEAVFEEMLKILGRPSSRHYAHLLDVYANHGMVNQGEDLFRRLRESSVVIRMCAWDALMKLYIGVGEVEKADATLEEAIQQKMGRPHIQSFLNILEAYAGRGDVQNAEKIFEKIRNAGYAKLPRPYHSLLYAYVNSRTPADGFDERLRRDRVVPDKKLARLLARAAAFREPVAG